MRSEEFIKEHFIGQASPLGSNVAKKKKKDAAKKNAEEIVSQMKKAK